MDFLEFDTVSSTYSWIIYDGGLVLLMSYLLGILPAWKNWKGSKALKEKLFNAGVLAISGSVISVYESASVAQLAQIEALWPVITGVVGLIFLVKQYYISKKGK